MCPVFIKYSLKYLETKQNYRIFVAEMNTNLMKNLMRKVHLLLFALLVGLPTAMFAGPRSFQQALKIAERQAALLGITMDESAVSQAKSFGRKTSAGSISGTPSAYYVFPNGEDKGFTIVSGDDRLPEIVGYSDRGTFDSENLSANYVSFMKAYQEMVELMDKGDRHVKMAVAEGKTLRASGYQQPKVKPLLGEIAWNQSAPYNNMCPIYNGKDHAVTGCVATAMAQVMAYYKYPKQLLEDIPQYTRQWNGNTITVPAISKSDGVYDWDNMLPVYTSGSYSEAQANAVAKLMFHCGAAVQMGYGPQSGGNVTPKPLAKYFGYDADLMLDIARSTYTLAEWTQMMDNELVAGRPILYSGSSTDGGHEFVCDGADGNGLYHINWGWGGYQNGYFDVTILNPEKGGIGSGSASDGYNRGCGMLIGVVPDNGKVDEPLARMDPVVMVYIEDTSLFELTKATRTNSSDKFSLKIVNWFNNQSQSDFTGYLALGVKNISGDYEPISPKKNLSLKGAEANGATYWGKLEFTFDYAFPVGTTTIYAIYSVDGVNWQKCAYYNMSPYVVNATEKSLSKLSLQLTGDIVAAEELLSGMDNKFTVSISNTGDFEYLGALDVYVNTTNTQPEKATKDIYVTVPAHSTITRTVELTPEAGDLYLWVVENQTGTALVNAKKFTVSTSTAPVLSMVKAWSNATPGLFETENAVYNKTNKVKAPKVEGDQAVFSYDIKNDGGTATVRYVIYGLNCETMSYAPSSETIRLPGNGAVTTISRGFTPEEVGSRTICSGLHFYDGVTYSTSLPRNKLYTIINPNSWYNLEADELIVYVSGSSTGISSISTSASSGSFVRGGKGEIVVLSDVAKRLPIYNLNGQKVMDVNVEAGVQQNIPITSGLYVVDGKKVVVK